MSAVALQTVGSPRKLHGPRPAPSTRSLRSDDGSSSHRTTYFERYPARPALENGAADKERIMSKVPASLNGHGNGPSRRIRTVANNISNEVQANPEPPKVAWPTKPEDSSPTPSGRSSPESLYSAPIKSQAASSSLSKPKSRSSVTSTLPELRHSASTLNRSSFSPPHTPVVHNAPFSMDNVAVAAPIFGVEMMDAFVDGMNGVFGENSSSGENDFRNTSRAKRISPRKHHISTEKRKTNLSPITPPLPDPPRGIKLGVPLSPLDNEQSNTDEGDTELPPRPPRGTRPRTRSSTNPTIPRASSSQTLTNATVRRGRSSTQLRTPKTPPEPLMSTNPTIDQIIKEMVLRGDEKVVPKSSRPSMAPSISDIIRTHAPELNRHRLGRAATPALPPSPEAEHEDSAASRSSLDSITNEAQSSMQKANPSALHHARSFPNRPIGMASTSAPPTTYDGGRRSVRISESEHEPLREPTRYAHSVYSASSYGVELTPSNSTFFYSPPAADSAMGVAHYLRSPRLTKLMTLRKPPHRGLNISLADVGNPNGRPVLVFLGLGCVRYIVALYDEMAEALGLRLIAIDRWGMGRTAEVPQDQRGLKEWAAICEEVLDTLGIQDVGILAHSAGAPYALAFALRMGRRVNGSIHLLAPWVGGGVDATGYKWLKYVPNSLIKAAQNAEWKVHGWKLGKPPTIVYEGIEFDPKAPIAGDMISSQSRDGPQPLTADALKGIELSPPPKKASLNKMDIPRLDVVLPSSAGRPSLGGWSDYDDLADFEGRFGSTTTLATVPPVPPLPKGVQSGPLVKRKGSKGFFNILKSPPTASRSPSISISQVKENGVKLPPKLKGLRSISSIKERLTGSKPSPSTEKAMVFRLDTTIDSFGSGLGIDIDKEGSIGHGPQGIEEWGRNVALSSSLPGASPNLRPESPPASPWASDTHSISSPRRSVSLTVTGAESASKTKTMPALIHRPSSSPARPVSSDAGGSVSTYHTPPRIGARTMAPTSSVATALLRASHKEAQRGLANDLLSILERDSKPWGFQYSDVPHKVKIWYGDRDEKIGEPGIRWMERVMQECELKICKGKDHGLMTCADVVVEALESLQEELRVP